MDEWIEYGLMWFNGFGREENNAGCHRDEISGEAAGLFAFFAGSVRFVVVGFMCDTV